MKKKIIDILICTLLFSNPSVILGFPEEQIKTIREEKSITLVDPLSSIGSEVNFY